ncbi:MAG: hypothetical protein ACRYFZ_02465 [Janthinobacterium lividum]
MKYLLFAGALLLATSCTRPPSAQPPQSEPIGADALTPDSTLATRHVQVDSVVVERPATFWDKVLHRTPKPYTVAPIVAQRSISIGRKSNVSVYYGSATVITNTAGKNAQLAAGAGAVTSHIEKKAGPAIVASDSSTLNAIAGGGNLAAVHGDGNQLEQHATTQQPPDWRAMLAKPVGAVLASVVAVSLVGGVIFLIAAYKRSKKLANEV